MALLIGGYNVDEVGLKQFGKIRIQIFDTQDLLADVEVYSPDGRCGGVNVADLPSPRCFTQMCILWRDIASSNPNLTPPQAWVGGSVGGREGSCLRRSEQHTAAQPLLAVSQYQHYRCHSFVIMLWSSPCCRKP